jgi:hypothetical protein
MFSQTDQRLRDTGFFFLSIDNYRHSQNETAGFQKETLNVLDHHPKECVSSVV